MTIEECKEKDKTGKGGILVNGLATQVGDKDFCDCRLCTGTRVCSTNTTAVQANVKNAGKFLLSA